MPLPSVLGAISTASVLAGFGLTAAVRRYALAAAMLDVPNERSSHAVPTPRGGGVSIVVVTLVVTIGLALAGLVRPAVAIALVGGGAAVALVGWLDDRRGLSASVRGATHVAASTWAVVWLAVGSGPASELGALEAAALVVALTWCVNFYNFMDGIDGLAAAEAACVGLAAAGLLLAAGAVGLAGIALAVAGASLGFLRLNWSPARIFMGDVGSGFLGFAFGCLAVASHAAGALPLPVWTLLLGVFLFDATVTLGRRLVRGERWYAAHREHAYQRAVQSGAKHARVTLAVVAVNLVLAALAWGAARQPAWVPILHVVAVVILSALYVSVERRRPMRFGELAKR